MANAQRGEVEIIVNEKPYTLKLSTNVAASVETRDNKKFGQILMEASELSLKSFRLLMWMLLQKHHAAEFKTVESVGNFIDEAGGIGQLLITLKDIADVNRPEKGNGASAENPLVAQDETANGTGEPSTSAPDESA